MRIGINGRHLGKNKTGVGRYLLSILEVWSQEAPQHEFYVYYSNEDLQKEDKDVFEKSDHMVLRQVPRPFGTNSFLLWYNFSLPRTIHKDKIDFFFSPDYFLPPFLGHIPSSMTIHDVSYLAHPEWFSIPYKIYCQIYSKQQARSASLIFAVSQFSKKEILKHISISPDRVHVTPEASHLKFDSESPSIENLKSLRIFDKYFFYVGKMFNRRHIAEMLEAFSQYLDKSGNREIQFVLRGKNETYPFIDIDKITKTINAKNNREAVIMLPFIDDSTLLNLYKNAAGFFYLSSYEGFGLPVLESLACGTPTITVRATSIPEVAGNTAIYVDPTDITKLSEVMARLLSDNEWVNTLRQKSIEQAANFSWQITASATLRAIEKIQ